MTFIDHISLLIGLLSSTTRQTSRSKVKEILNCHVKLDVQDPNNMFVSYPHRQLDLGYVAAQLAWYLRAKPGALDGIQAYHPSWRRVKTRDNGALDINSNYGVYVWRENQWRLCVLDRLAHDPMSRQAIILFNRPDVNVSHTQDHICTTSLQFLIRDDKLHLITTMRSNDFWFGYCYDVPFFIMLMELTAVFLQHEGLKNLTLGSYFHNVGSMHLYEKDWEQAQLILGQPLRERTGCPPLSSYEDAEMIVSKFGELEQTMRLNPAQSKFSTTEVCPRFNWLSKNLHDTLLKIQPQ